jgi:nicotinamide-nucleotide amidase
VNTHNTTDPHGIIHRTAAIVSCGDEITLGQTLDTNSKWLSSKLADAGVLPVEHVTLPDDLDAQRDAFARLASRVDLIVASGGLGPTADDLTREALASAANDHLVEDADSLQQINAWFAARGRSMGPLNAVQARRPSRGRCLENKNGTAPGLHSRLPSPRGSCDVFCLPGPPRELFPMFESHVLPAIRLEQGRIVRTRVLHTFGMGESDIAAALGPMMNRDGPLLVGTTASMGVVSCRIRFQGPATEAEALATLDHAEADIRARLGPYIFAAGEHTLASSLVALLSQRNQTLAVVESCTGGLLGQLISDVPGASKAFLGGLITYSNQLKTSLAHVPASMFSDETNTHAPGAVSQECAKALALGGLSATGADHALAITGIAGPSGAVPAAPGRPAKPVGTIFIARASRPSTGTSPAVTPETEVRRFQMTGDRAGIREWTARSALAMLLFALQGHSDLRFLRQVD